MKKIIRFLASYFGVENDIRKEERQDIAGELISASYWFTDYKKYPYLYPFVKYLGGKLQNNDYLRGDSSREFLDALMQEDPSIAMHLEKIRELYKRYGIVKHINH